MFLVLTNELLPDIIITEQLSAFFSQEGDPLSPMELFIIYLLTYIFKASTKPCLHLFMVQHRVGSPLDSIILGTALPDPTTTADIAAECSMLHSLAAC